MAQRSFDLDVLRTLVASVDFGSFSNASLRVGRSQSAVSAQLTKLSQQVGCQIYHRSGRSFALTAEGELLVSYARRLLSLNDEAMLAIQGEKGNKWIRIGLPQDLAEVWLPEILSEFSSEFPNIQVEVASSRNIELLQRMRAGSLDVVLAWGNPEGPYAERVASLPMVWIGPTKEIDCRAYGPTVPLVSFEAPCRFREVSTSALNVAGRPWRIAFAGTSLSGSWAAVAGGLGVCPRTPFGLPSSVRVLSSKEIRLPALPDIPMSIYRSGVGRSDHISRFSEMLFETVRKNVDGLN